MIAVADLEPGMYVRILANDAGVEVGRTCRFVRFHEESGNPLISTGGRPVAMLDDQIEVMDPQPEGAVIIRQPKPVVRQERPERPERQERAAVPQFSWTPFDPLQATVTFGHSGVRLSQRASEKLGEPEYVEILFDAASGAVGIVKAAAGSDRLLAVTREKSGARIPAAMFIRLLDLSQQRNVPVKYPATMGGDGMLIVTGVPFKRKG